MTTSPNPPRLPEGLRHGSDPVGKNPFPVGHPLHGVWATATRAAEESALRFDSEVLSAAVPPDAEEFNINVVMRISTLFDIWTDRFVNVVVTDKLLDDFDEWSFNYSNECLKTVQQQLMGPQVLREAALAHLTRELARKLSHWKAEARRYLAQVKEVHGAASDPPPTGPAARPASSSTTSKPKTLGGAGLAAWLRAAMDRREAHMTVNRLYKLSGVDPKTIKGLLAGEARRRSAIEKLCSALKVDVSRVPLD